MPSDQDLHKSLFFICLVISDQTANSQDPDQMARLIWIYTVHPCHQGIYMKERVKSHYGMERLNYSENKQKTSEKPVKQNKLYFVST
jgi:hypothetical protein